MKILAGFFYVLVFAGILTAAYLRPLETPGETVEVEPEEPTTAELLADFNRLVANSEWDSAQAELARLVEGESITAESHAILTASISMMTDIADEDKRRTLTNQRLLASIDEKLVEAQKTDTRALKKLEASVESVGDTLSGVAKQMERFESRIEELEARPIPPVLEVEEPGETEETSGEGPGGENTPENPEEMTDEEPAGVEEPPASAPVSIPEPKPAPRTVSIPFPAGSLNFSGSASDDLKGIAEKLLKNDELQVALSGYTTGFASSLANGRASAVQAKLAEFGVDVSRITVSEEAGKGSDSVSVSFKKKPAPTPES